jgi:DNA-binding NarL/FixJ family response regulator
MICLTMQETADPATSARIAIADPLPAFRLGVMTTLGDLGVTPESPDDLLAWVRSEQRRVILLTLASTEDWVLLAELRQARTDLVIIAILTDVDVGTYLRAILAGAVTAVPRNAPPDQMKRVFRAAVEGVSMLPVAVVQALAARTLDDRDEDPEGRPSRLTVHEIQWLRELAEGTTVAHLAELTGYSERAMFRLLRDLYARMGVRNRTEALMRARELGWV